MTLAPQELAGNPKVPLVRVFESQTLQKEQKMAALKPGQNTGNRGGIFQQVGPRGGKQENYVAVPDHKPLPPTTHSGHGWVPVKTTPDSKR